MLEAEALWSRDDAASGRAVARHATRGAALAAGRQSDAGDGQPRPGAAPPRFVQLSPRQAAALAEHHRAWVQMSSRVSRRAAMKREASSSLALGEFRRYHSQPSSADGKPLVTGLSRLDSQYVGPIGVGTVVEPEHCVQKPGTSLVYLAKGPEEQPVGSSHVEVERTCHMSDQSQVFVVFDTGSTNIWVSSDLCKEGACAQQGRTRYNHSRSVTFQEPEVSTKIDIKFGTGGLSGPLVRDDFHIGPFTVYNQTFGMIEREDGKVFFDVPFEGILGLAFPKMSANGVAPFFDNIVRQGALSSPRRNEFAFYFSLDDPSANAVMWGGVDPAFYEDPIEWFPVVEPFYWSLSLRAFGIGNETLLADGTQPSGGSGAVTPELLQELSSPKHPKAIIDTGTTFFTAQDGLFEEVMKRLRSAPCDGPGGVTEQSHPPITYTLMNAHGESRDFVLTNKMYMTRTGEGEGATCSPAFMRINIPRSHGDALVLGEVFMRHFFTVFDRGDGHPSNARAGFARSRTGAEVSKQLKALTKDQPSFTLTHGSAGGE